MAEQTFQLPANTFMGSSRIKRWVVSSSPGFGHIDSALVENPAWLDEVRLDENGQVLISQTPRLIRDFTPAVRINGLFTLTSGEHSVDFGIFGADMQEPYRWFPDNVAEVVAFYNAIGTSDVAATLTIRDFIHVAPAFADPTGDAITGTGGEAIAAVTVPAAVGVAGNEQTFQLPGSAFSLFGLSTKRWRIQGPPGFGDINNVLRVLQGSQGISSVAFYLSTVSMLESGWMFLNLTDARGTDLSGAVRTNGLFTLTSGEHSVDFGIFGADMQEPYRWFPDNVAEVVAFYNAIGTSDVAATLTIRDYRHGRPPAPLPTYAAVGALPAGVMFDGATRRLSFDEDAIEEGSGTIRIRASNSAGMADWTVPYSFEAGTIPVYFGGVQMKALHYGAAEIERINRGATRIV